MRSADDDEGGSVQDDAAVVVDEDEDEDDAPRSATPHRRRGSTLAAFIARVSPASHNDVASVRLRVASDTSDGMRAQPLQDGAGAPEHVGEPSVRRACCADNVRALWLLLALNTGYTALQTAGAILANSLSLLSDTGTMYVDSVTYLINLFAEYQKTRQGMTETSMRYEVGATVFSIISLLGVTAYTMDDAVKRLVSAAGREQVSAPIMLGFGLCNLILDASMISSIAFRRRCSCAALCCCGGGRSGVASLVASKVSQVDGGEADGVGGIGDGGGDGGGGGGGALYADGGVDLVDAKTELNLCSAFAHVVADTLRSLTDIAVALLIMRGNDAVRTDAVGGLVISLIILGVICYLCREVMQHCPASGTCRRRHAGGGGGGAGERSGQLLGEVGAPLPPPAAAQQQPRQPSPPPTHAQARSGEAGVGAGATPGDRSGSI